MKSKVLVILGTLLTLVPWMSRAADTSVSGKWDSDRQARGGVVTCMSASPPALSSASAFAQRAIPSGPFAPGQGPRGIGDGPGFGDGPRGGLLDRRTPVPQSEFSIDLKMTGGRLSGVVTLRWVKPGGGACMPDVAGNKFEIRDGEVDPGGKTFTFRMPADVGGVRVITVWHGELLYPDTLMVRRESTSGAPADDQGDILFHRSGRPTRVTIEGKVTVEGGEPFPRFGLTFTNTTPLRVTSPGFAVPVGGFGGGGFGGFRGAAGQPSSTSVDGSKFSVNLPVSDYQIGVTNLPSGYFIKSMTAGSVDLRESALSVPGAAGKVRIAVNLGVASPPPWVKVSGRVGIPGASRIYLKGEALADEFSTFLRSGTFEFSRVVPGSYTLRVAASNGRQISRTIVVGSTDLADIEILPVPSHEIVGEFVKILPGEFKMGCLPEDGCGQPAGRFGGVRGFSGVPMPFNPPTTRRIEKQFELGKYEVTQKQWEAVMGENPSVASPSRGTAARGSVVGNGASVGPDFPVERVGWNDVQKFVDKLNKLNDGYRYRLPTSVEWEYAARAGGGRPTAGASLGDLLLPGVRAGFSLDNVWHAENSGGRSHRVGELAPNAWGLHDMLGNVEEWVVGPSRDRTYLTRGGSFNTPGPAISVPMETKKNVVGNLMTGLRLARQPVR